MKYISALLVVFSLLLVSCEGDPGPPGPPGLIAQSFERTVDFGPPFYEATLEIPLTIELFESDMVLVYRFLGQIDGLDVWKILPETVYIETGEEFQYNFEHNFDFVTLFIDAPATFNFNDLLPQERLNQTFRVVVIPTDLVFGNNIDITNFEEVAAFLQ